MLIFNYSFLISEYSKLGLLLLVCFFIPLFIYILSRLLGAVSPDFQKNSIYECGFEPYADARRNFDVRFYLIAILFLIFDLETVYFFPWCVSLKSLDYKGFFVMVDFVIELLFGYYYAWYIGALDWN
jgi:NADH-quinone oxidoreductase subunit A